MKSLLPVAPKRVLKKRSLALVFIEGFELDVQDFSEFQGCGPRKYCDTEWIPTTQLFVHIGVNLVLAVVVEHVRRFFERAVVDPYLTCSFVPD